MIFLLTGERQVGKTRWLEALAAQLAARGVPVCGLIAPGVWIEHGAPDGAVEREKVGIDNVLLPQGERIPFARRSDLARAEGSFDAEGESARAGLGWEIAADALRLANGHMASLGSKVAAGEPMLLVVDELGPLELVHGGGLAEALALLDAGPADASAQHALAVVRPELVDIVAARFAKKWGDAFCIAPDDAGHKAVLSVL